MTVPPLFLLLLVNAAEAYDVRLCAQYEPDYSEQDTADLDPGDADGDGVVDNDWQDFMNPDTEYESFPMRGLLMKAHRQMPDGSWELAWEGYAEPSGPHVGCTEAFVAPPLVGPFGAPGRVRLMVFSEVEVNDLHVNVKDDPSSNKNAYHLSPEVDVWSSGSIGIDFGTGDARFDMAMAVAFAFVREDGGVPQLTYDMFVDGVGPRHYAGDNEIHLGGHRSVFVALHELGHAIAWTRMPFVIVGRWAYNDYEWSNYDGGDTECPAWDDSPVDQTHYFDSDEASADAIGEGFASYYALSVLNRRDEGDAFFFFAYTDWDHDQLSEWGWYSAEQRPLTTHPTTMNADYWEHECQQPVQNIASEYDWMRGLWDLDTDHGVSTAEILSVFADVGPSDWTVTPDVDCGAAGIECPAIEILDAAGAYWFGSSWSFECEDGICR